jgi:hypothetical protein
MLQSSSEAAELDSKAATPNSTANSTANITQVYGSEENHMETLPDPEKPNTGYLCCGSCTIQVTDSKGKA